MTTTDDESLTVPVPIEAEVTVAFRVMGADLDPDGVSKLLEMQATESHRRGDPHVGRSGRRYADYTGGLWLRESGLPLTDPLRDHLHSLLDLLVPRAAALDTLKQQGLRLDVFIGVFGGTGNSGFAVERQHLEQLGRLGLTLEFDVYC